MAKKKTSDVDMENKKESKIFDASVKIFLLIILVFFFFYLYKNNNSFSDSTQAPTRIPSMVSQTSPTPIDSKLEWKNYESKEFGFALKYPPSLSINDLGSVGGYLNFIRFEEEPALGLSEKGIAVGVSALSIEKEVEKIKAQIQKEGGAVLAEESQIELKGFIATRLSYHPEDSKDKEERAIVVVKGNGKYTYSLSTTPEQMSRLTKEFTFYK